MATQLSSRYAKTFVILLTVSWFCYSLACGINRYHKAPTYSRSNQSVTVSLYYESLCPGCMDFATNSLCPLWVQMSSYIKADFVPYGNAKTHISDTGVITFECQHGPEECAANFIHACAIKHLSYTDSTKFVCCMEGRHNAPGSGPACSKDLEIDYDPIQTCAEGSEGVQLHYEYGERTGKLQPAKQYVPWILFNGIYNQADMDHSRENLRAVVCKYLGEPQPDECNEAY